MKNIYNNNQKQPHGSQGMRNVGLFKMTKNVVTIPRENMRGGKM